MTQESEKQRRAIRFVRQRWDELLKPNADVTRRVRTLSPRTAADEAVALARSKVASDGHTRRGEQGERAGHGIQNLPDVVGEAIDLIGSDPALHARDAELRDRAVWALKGLLADPLTEKETLRAELLVRALDHAYARILQSRLLQVVTAEPHRLEELDCLLGHFVAELRARGWDDGVLREAGAAILTNDDDPGAKLKALFDAVSQQQAKFECLVEVDLAQLDHTLPIRLEGVEIQRDNAGDRTFLQVQTLAFDPSSAARAAASSVATLLGAASVFLEGGAVDVVRGAAVRVRRQGQGDFDNAKPGHDFIRESRRAVAGQLERILTSVWSVREVERASADPLFDAVRFYERAAATTDTDTRFVLLWFGLERLVAGAGTSLGGVEGAIRTLIPPAISLGKARRELSAWCATMRDSAQGDAKTKVLELLGVGSEVAREKVLARLMAPETEFDEMVGPIYSEYPAQVRWLCKLRKVFGPEDGSKGRSGPVARRIHSYLAESSIRTERQLLRLYRARNGMAHAGLRPALIHDLIGHGAFYLTNLIAISVTYRERAPTALPARIFAERGAEFDIWLERLGAENASQPTIDEILRPRGFVI